MNFVISRDNQLVIGAPENVNWDGSQAELINASLNIVNGSEVFFIDELNPYAIMLIKRNRSIILSYIRDGKPSISKVLIEII